MLVNLPEECATSRQPQLAAPAIRVSPTAMTSSLDTFVAHVGSLLNSPELHLNQHRICRFTLDEKLEVTVEECNPPDAVHCYAVVAKNPPSGRERLYATMLEAQLFGTQVGDGMRFGLDDAEGEILIEKHISLSGLDKEAFATSLEEFVNWAFFWTDKLVPLLEPEPFPNSHAPALDPPRFEDFARFNFIRA